MRITYDASADAAYIYLVNGAECVETRQIDDDINIDFNHQDQIVGIEVLGASKRLRLSEIEQDVEKLDTDWVTLVKVLEDKKEHNIPITVSKKDEKVWVEEVGFADVVLKSESGELLKVKAYQLLGSPSANPLIETLCKMGNYGKTQKVD